MKLSRIVSCVLALFITAGLAGCRSNVTYTSEYYYEDVSGGGGAPAGTGSDEAVSGGTAGAGTSGGGHSSSGAGGSETVEEVDVRGYNFTLVSEFLPSEVSSSSTGFEKNLFNRIEEVERQYGCDISIINSYATTPDNLQPLILAGKKVGDAVEVIATRVLSLAKNNYIIPWDDVSGIDVSDSRFIQGYNRMATYDGKVYGVQFMKPVEVRMCVIFNKSILKSAGIDADGLYTQAADKKWNFAMLRDYARRTTRVVNGTTTVWGLGGTPLEVAKSLIRANNGLLVSYNGTASAAYTSSNVIEALDYFNTLVNTDKVYMTADGMGSAVTFGCSLAASNRQFIDGKLAFLIAESWVINQQIKGNVSFDYGMLPVPIGTSASDYIGNADNARVWCMTSTNAESEDYKKSVFIFNELTKPSEGYEGDDWWEYDVKQEYFQTESADKDIEMYKLCIDTASVDVGWGIVSMREDFTQTAVYGPIFWNTTTPTAAVSSLEGTYDRTISSMFNK